MSVSWANIAAWLQDCTAKENGAQKMGRIFYIMGKSATGKDTVFKELLKRRPELTTVVPYTTRPIREGETDGVEYFFTSSEKLEQFKNSGKIVELRTYETVMGPWSYFTMDDGQFDIHGEGDCLMIGTLESYEKMCRYYGNGALVPVYIEVPDGIRLLRAVKREGKQITQRDMEHFLSKTGTDMSNIEKELEKLLCYTMDRSVITGEDIDAVCTTQINNRIFAMVQAVAEQNQKKALDLYYDLLALKEPPMRILFLLARQFNLLLQVKELQRLGCDQKTIASRMGLQSFVVRNYTGCTGRYTTAQLRQAVEDFTQTEEEVKTGRLSDVLSVELLIVKYARKNPV